MAGRMIIEDSDDDSDGDGSPSSTGHQSFELSLDTIIDLPSSSPPKIMQQSEQPSTGSTERLNRDLREAHDNLLEPTPESKPSTTRSRHSSEPPQLSPQLVKSQNRRATVEFSRDKEKKRKKYGRASRDGGDFYSHSEDELGERSVSQISSQRDVAHEQVRDNSDALEDSAAASRVNAMLNSYIGTETPIFGSGGLGNQFSIETSIQRASVPTDPLMRIGAQSQQSDPSTWPTIPNTTPARSISTEHASTNGVGANEFHANEEEDPEASNGQTASRAFASSHPPKTVSSAKDHTDKTSQALIQDELSLTISSNLKRAFAKLPETQDQDQAAAADELGSDDLAIGLPKDQYHPRPSRSRGSRNENELMIPENFSKRPEDLVKGKRKVKNRRKTTALAKPSPKIELDSEDEDEVELPVVAIPKLSPSLKGRYPYDNETDWAAFQKENPGQAAAIGKYLGNHSADEEDRQKRAPQSPSPKKRGRGRPKKQATQQDEDGQVLDSGADGDDHDKGLANIEESTEVPPANRGSKKLTSAVDAASEPAHSEEDDNEGFTDDQECQKSHRKRKSDIIAPPPDDEQNIDMPDFEESTPAMPKPRGRKKRGIDTNAALGDSDHDDTVTDAAQSAKAPPKKRGRKKKAEQPAASAPVILLDHEGERSEHPGNENVDDHGDQPPNVLAQSEGNAARAASAKLTTPPITPPKTAKPVHSPLNSSTVKYRVGLSKKARIAPLLRIVRK